MTVGRATVVRWFNAIGYQAIWFALVIGASHGDTGWALVAGGVFVVAQVALGGHVVAEAKRLGMALLFGMVIDGVPSMLGWWHYASPSPALPPGGAPAWILMLWLCFATTLSRSLSFVQGRPALAALLGAIGAPMAYLAAARGWQALLLPASPVFAVAWLAATWAAALPVLAYMAADADRLSHRVNVPDRNTPA